MVHREFINRKTHDIWDRTISHLDLCHFHGVYICGCLFHKGTLSFIVVVFFPCDLRLNISIVWFVGVSVRFYQGDLYKHTHFSYLKFFFHLSIMGMKYSCITNLTKIKEYTII